LQKNRLNYNNFPWIQCEETRKEDKQEHETPWWNKILYYCFSIVHSTRSSIFSSSFIPLDVSRAGMTTVNLCHRLRLFSCCPFALYSTFSDETLFSWAIVLAKA
jgi:hypothetical protein